MKLLEVEDLCVQYPGKTKPACQVSFQVETGELLGIAGASGAGKSTAMLALMDCCQNRWRSPVRHGNKEEQR